MTNELRAAGFPRWWYVEPPEIIIECIFVNWLYHEIDQHIEEKLPTLRTIHGYRNIEVYGYLQNTREDRERKICLAVYGSAEPIQNV